MLKKKLNFTKPFKAKRYIRESNLIENIDDKQEDEQSLRAWEYLSNCDNMSQTALLTTHRLITQNQLNKRQAGFYRDVNVMVGGRVCPAPHLAEQLIYNWLMDLHQHQQTLDPTEMHVRFEKIHPFIDGNGRTGRMLMWWHELKLNKKPTLYKNKEKQDKYYPLFRD